MNKTTTLLLKFSSGTLISTSSRNVWKLPNVLPFITARNEVGARLCFYTCLWFCSQGGGIPACIACGIQGGWYPSMPCRSPGPHPRGKLRGLAWGVSRPTPGGGSPGTHPGVRVSQHALRQTPPHTDGYCGRYASYWNAFLFTILFRRGIFQFIKSLFISELNLWWFLIS